MTPGMADSFLTVQQMQIDIASQRLTDETAQYNQAMHAVTIQNSN
jgi:hypothetical protein